ncbi:hypothetical protein ABL78_6501 [Leptomonas seymouri]|uniref:Uncharacterized protein n=1 Tax=Leptomonas seymouri TaxID=5684 RepID=A0A0N0P3R8_LEPSE|nr:hypothetical protein ABL78_6501 [Leptomonas seymouri]|eukprot:KPI84446.1 hypothetical protein ABL78_6501 [Leptomonas seymouri]
MLHHDLKTAVSPLSSSGASAGPATTEDPAASMLNEVPWTAVDEVENASFDSPASIHSGDGNFEGGSPGSASHPHSPQTLEQQVLLDQNPYPHCPIFILSKGRSDLERSTMATFVRDLVPFVLVVERDEAEAYGALLDHLVGKHFGFAGMIYSPQTAGAGAVSPLKQSETNGEQANAAAMAASEAEAPATAPDLWDFPCACCCGSNGGNSGANGGALPLTAIETLANRLSTSFHHGYVFDPTTYPTSGPADVAREQEGGFGCADVCEEKDEASQRETAEQVVPAIGGSATLNTRRPSPAFVLHEVSEIRALFRIEVLPEANRGVSYVRNYILQVLAPRVMVACGVDQSGNLEELCLSGHGDHSTLTPAALHSATLGSDVYKALQKKADMEKYLNMRRGRVTTPLSGDGENAKAAHTGATTETHSVAAAETTSDNAHKATSSSLCNGAQGTRDTPRLLHGLFGFYWVLDDDIYGFYEQQVNGQKHQRISCRAMLRRVESRLRLMRRNADLASPTLPTVPSAASLAPTSASSPTAPASSYAMPPPPQQQQYIFTCKEDALANNFINGGKVKFPTQQNYTLFYRTACFSLEYNCFAISSTPDSLSVNSYNNIACLFNYNLLHNPPQIRYFPPGVANVRRPEDALVGYLGYSMLWYRFAIREDYDFTLQLIARGLYTLRFRGISFDVPQMMKVRGGMTDYYRNCHEDIRQQNDRFVLQWPAVAQHWVKGKEHHKREDIRVRWDLLSPARVKYPGAFLYLDTPLPQLQPQRTAAEDSTDVTEGGSDDQLDTAGAESHKRARPASPTTAAPESGGARRIDSDSPKATERKAIPTPAAPTTRDWRSGYVMERWRYINPEEAKAHAGLIALPNDGIHIGQTVAAIPPFFEQRPSVVLATVIERSVVEESGSTGQHVVWTAVAQDVRGMPFLHIKTCYQPPAEGIVKAAERLDRFFSSIAT